MLFNRFFRGVTVPVTAFLLLLTVAACDTAPPAAQSFQATAAPVNANAPVYTHTPTLPPTLTHTPSHTPTHTATLTLTPTLTYTPSPTFTATQTPALITLTAASVDQAPAGSTPQPAEFTIADGWSCVEYPCADDIAGFLQRIRVPDGYLVEHVGQFPAQPIQIAYGRDQRLYATTWENGTLSGGIYALDLATGQAARYTQATFYAPSGIAFQPETDVLYISGRVTPTSGGGLWRVLPDGIVEPVLEALPCCLDVIGNQPNGMIFGQDGYLYLGVGALTDHGEPKNPRHEQYSRIQPFEASVLRIQPHTGDLDVFAEGIRNPQDLTMDANGQLYVTDNGILAGTGDRVLRVDHGGHYGFPYWRDRDCFECPPTDFSLTITPDMLPLPDYTLPRGLVAYTGAQFPAAVFNHLFVAQWNTGQIVRIDPAAVPTDPEALASYSPPPFMTGLIRPTDVIVASDGSLLVADFIHGHVWRVRYVAEGETAQIAPTQPAEQTSNGVFVTSTPRP